MAATLDIVAVGRLELGLGAGWNEEESGASGIELGSPRDRSDRFEEVCAVLVGLLSRETTTFEGRFYRLDAARCEPKPLQRPHPRLCVGGNGEQRTLRMAARFAQHWNFVGGPVEVFARKRQVLHEHCARIGREAGEILLSSHVPFDGGAAATVATAAALAVAGCELAIVQLRPPHRPEVLEPLARALQELG